MKACALVLIITFGLTLSLPQISKGQNELLDFIFPKDRSPSKANVRIIGGDEAVPHAYPYQVGLFLNNPRETVFCGGSLITTDTVLTAAHCVDEASSAQVVLGAHEILKDESTTVKVNSNVFIIHEDWDRKKLINDIAFIKLPQPVTLNKNIQTIEIASGKDTYAEEMAVLTGWGYSSDMSTGIEPALKVVNDTVITNKYCSSWVHYEEVIKDEHVCTDGTGHVGACNGDSGGPLVVNGKQIGIASFGYVMCEVEFPSVYTRLTLYYDWIQNHL